MIYLVEHFYSIQGEGKYMGFPSLFFRFGGCNLQCQGFQTEYSINKEVKLGCDSFYSVDSYFKEEWQQIDKVETLITIIKSYPHNIKHIVFTGGEPLIYANNPIFLQFIQYLNKSDFYITIETNGTVELHNREEFKSLTYSIAIKLSNSGEEYSKRINLKALQSLIQLSDNIFFKFTIDKNSILNNINSEIQEIHNLFPNIPIYCMAIGKNLDELETNSRYVVQFCLDNGYMYSDRLHIRLWNGKRGF